MDEWIPAAAEGSNEAWSKIVADLGPALHAFARARGIRDPDELVQDVLLDAARKISSFVGDWTGFRSWMFTIAYRRLADHHRRNGRRLPTMPIEDERELPPLTTTPEDSAVRSDTIQRLLGSLDSLSQIEKDVVLLRVVAELSSDEVADIVGKSPGNVRVIQNRALARIRQNLDESKEKNFVTKSTPERLPA